MDRTASKHCVMEFDPSREPSVAEQLKAEQAKDPTVTGLSCTTRLGMVQGPKGTYWLDTDGVGGRKPLEKEGCPVLFYRERAVEGGGTSMEVVPFVKAVYSLAECVACATGVHTRLDCFVETGKRQNANYEMWESNLS